MALETDLAGIHRLFDDVTQRSDRVVGKHERLIDQVADFRTYVDRAAGTETGAGTKKDPVQTIQQALDLTPLSARATIHIRGDYKTTRKYIADGRHVSLLGCDAAFDPVPVDTPNAYPAFSFGVIEQTDRPKQGPRQIRRLANFDLSDGAYWDLTRWKIAMPSKQDVASAKAALPDSPNHNTKSLFALKTQGPGDHGGATLHYSDLNIPQSPYGTILGQGGFCSLFVATLTVSGQSDMGGHIMPGVPKGTETHTLGHRLGFNRDTL